MIPTSSAKAKSLSVAPPKSNRQMTGSSVFLLVFAFIGVATTFYGYGELLLRLREIIGGPVYSEGSMHWMYAGLVDGNYGQDKFYRFDENPWLVDFDLRRIHPLECDFGMGSPPNFFWRANVDPKSKTAIDRFLAATIAFGHTGFLLTYNNAAVRRSYSLIQPIAAEYDVSVRIDKPRRGHPSLGIDRRIGAERGRYVA